jgi:hypothetical protein
MIATDEVTTDVIVKLENEVKEKVEQRDHFFAAQITPEFAELRELVRAGKKDEAKRHFIETEMKVQKAEASYDGERTAWALFAIELCYLVAVMALAYAVLKYPNYWMWAGLVGLSAKTAWFGALGGISVALYGLYSHVQVRDFDSKYLLWYLSKPVIGAIFGWFIYLVYYVGLISVQGSNVDVKTPAVPYAIAFLAGFSERFTVKIIDKVMEVLSTWEDKSAPGSGPRIY